MFEVFRDRAGEFRARFKDRNGEVLFSTEGYVHKASAMLAIERIKLYGPDAQVKDLT